MTVLIVEMRPTPDERWERVSVPLSPTGTIKSGSLSSYEPTGRQIFEFGWMPYADHVGIWRPMGGVDLEVELARMTSSLEPREEICNLCEKREHTMEIYNRKRGRIEVRFRLEESP